MSEQPSVEALRAQIVEALNLTPLVPPQADTKTLNVVNEAWVALAALTAAYRKMEEERDEWEQRYTELLEAVGGTWPG